MDLARKLQTTALPVILALLLAGRALATGFVVSPDGDDGNPGDAAAPWRTVQHAANTLAAGDEVLVEAGEYIESVTVTRSGAAEAPIVFRFEPGAVLVSPDPDASFEAFDLQPGTGYVELVGVTASGGFDETIFLRSGVHDVRIEGCDLHHNHAGIIMADAFDIVVDHCLLHHNAALGIRFAGSTHDVLVEDTVSSLNNEGGGCNSSVDGFAAEPGSYALSFVRSKAVDNGGDGFDVQGEATLTDVESSGNACTGIKLWQDAEVRGCLVSRNARGIGVGSLYGNSVADIANCTIADNTGVGIDLGNSLAPYTTYVAKVRNSIVSGDFKAVQYTRAARLSESHNIFFRPNSYDPVLVLVGAQKTTGHDINLGRWARRSRGGQGTLAVAPLFVDAAAGDYHVVPTSAAVGRGIELAAATGDGVPPNLGAYADPTGPTNHGPFADAGRNRTGRVNRALYFNAAGSIDPDGGALTYVWDFGDGSTPVAGYRARHAFAAPGTYTVTLTASDGSLSASTTILVLVL